MFDNDMPYGEKIKQGKGTEREHPGPSQGGRLEAIGEQRLLGVRNRSAGKAPQTKGTDYAISLKQTYS